MSVVSSPGAARVVTGIFVELNNSHTKPLADSHG